MSQVSCRICRGSRSWSVDEVTSGEVCAEYMAWGESQGGRGDKRLPVHDLYPPVALAGINSIITIDRELVQTQNLLPIPTGSDPGKRPPNRGPISSPLIISIPSGRIIRYDFNLSPGEYLVC
jgi:hypothetical protein